jgi:3-phenylpropionate/trans-cinnamate dioxygenase ferredoxin reductase component
MSAGRAVIVGGGGAGDAAAFGLREDGFDGEIVILSADSERPYDRPYLSKEYLRGEIELAKVYLHEEGDYSRNRIDLRLDKRVTGGTLSGRRLTLAGGAELGFETLVLAPGGSPRWLPNVPRAENVFSLRSLRDSQALRNAIRAGRRLLLVGAGFIGAEVGASARTMGKEVLMVEAAPVPLSRALGEDVGRVYASIHASRGVAVRTATTIREWHRSGDRVVGVTLSDGSREEADLVLLGVGIEPNLEVPLALGLQTDAGGVILDESLVATGGVYCAGDIALHQHPLLGRPLRVEHWEVAKGQGRAVARSIASEPAPYSTLPYFWSDQYDVSLEYRGSASGSDRTVWRGDADTLSFSVFYLRDGLVDAVLSMNDGGTNEAAERLIQNRRPVDEGALADPGVDLAQLAVPASS